MPADEQNNLKEKIRRLPNTPGVYLMKDRLGRIIYVGKAKSLKKRVSTYFQPSRKMTLHPKIRALVEMIRDFELIEVKSETEALILEGKLIKEWKPRYNTDFTDDKRFLLIRIDIDADIPKFRLTRNRREDNARYFGPFTHSTPVHRTLAELRRKFGIVLVDASPLHLGDKRYRLYDDVRGELYGFPNEVTVAEYQERVGKACAFLEGKAHEWLESLRKQMLQAAENRKFEKAAELRDIIFALEKTLLLQKTRKFSRTSVPSAGSPESLLELQQALDLPEAPTDIECFDISHISGTFVVASMVHFTNGKPDKNQYRRYKIKSFIGNDDFRAMEEVVGRRYRRLAAENKPFPKLIVIDGGRGQVTAALRAFVVLDLQPPPIIGLAKREETVIFPDDRPPLNLPANNQALRLLQRVRDEAHRFANAFNADLRSRKIRESILEEVPGLGSVRRQALLAHFSSIKRLKKASLQDIAGAAGIGPKMAAEIHTFLHKSSPAEAREMDPQELPSREGDTDIDTAAR